MADPTAVKVDKAVEEAGKALEKLRCICPEDFDVERANSNLVGKLLGLELVRDPAPSADSF